MRVILQNHSLQNTTCVQYDTQKTVEQEDDSLDGFDFDQFN